MKHLHSVLLSLLCVAAPLAARAAGDGGEHGSDTVWHLVNLTLLIGVLVYFARSPLRTFMATRRQDIESGIEGAQHDLAEAERRLAECNERLETLDREVEEIRATVRAQAELERERLLRDAHAAAERIRGDAHSAVEQEVRQARESLRAEAAEMAVGLAAELLAQQVTDSDRSRLVDEFVQRVESPSDRPAARS